MTYTGNRRLEYGVAAAPVALNIGHHIKLGFLGYIDVSTRCSVLNAETVSKDGDLEKQCCFGTAPNFVATSSNQGGAV